MQVFKTYFKIILKNLPQMIIYLFVFLTLGILFSTTSKPTDITTFSDTPVSIALINEDQNSDISLNLSDYLKNTFNVVSIENNDKAKQDALFFQEVMAIATIPSGFSESFEKNESPKIDVILQPTDVRSYYIEEKINQFLTTYKRYHTFLPEISKEDKLENTKEDLSKGITTHMASFSIDNSSSRSLSNFYNFGAYVLLAILILGISSIMMVFNQKDLKNRNKVSPMKLQSQNFQLLVGSLCFALVVWLVLSIVGLFFFLRTNHSEIIFLLFTFNLLLMTLVSLSISFLVGIFIKGKNAQSGAANVLSLGLCFISGVFVSQDILGESVIAIAQFSPVYWFVKANTMISELTVFSMKNMIPIFTDMLILFSFGLAILSVALVFTKVLKEKN